MSDHRPRLAVFKFASCDGCQVSILNLEDEILQLSEQVDIAYFLEATSRAEPGPYDIALVEGSVTTDADAARIREIREQSARLITIGACAAAGGIQALRNVADAEEMKGRIYPHPEWVSSLATSTPISAHVKVDYEIHGCPVNKYEVLRVLLRALRGAGPDLSAESVCIECKRQGNVCVIVAKGIPCMGPVTRTGCGAICPSMGRDCYACFGPAEDPNPDALAREFERIGFTAGEIARRFRGMEGWRAEFRKVADRLEEREGEDG